MKKRILSLLLVLVMVLGMFPVSAMATNESRQDTVYISVSYDGQYINDAAGTPVAYLPVSLSALQAIDLASYGLSEYDYNGQLTALHLYIYTHEKIMGKDWDDVGVSGGAGSIFFENGLFGFQDCNLQYYYNGKYPEVDSWGVTADQLVLNSGDFFDIAAYTSWAFYSDSAFGFHYFLNNEEITHDYTATAGETLTVTLGRGASFMGSGSSMTKVAGYTVSYGAALGTATGTVTTDSDGTAEITFTEAGTYYLWVNGGYGSENPDDIVSAPGYAKVTVAGGTTECEHDWSAATCTEPKTCRLCSETEGEAAGHSWKDATCETPQTCGTCGDINGEADPDAHKYVSGSCEYCGESNPNSVPTGVTITAPIGSKVSVGTLKNYFIYTFAEPTSKVESTSTVTYTFDVPTFGGNSFVRVQHPDGVTYWDYVSMSEGTEITITENMLFMNDSKHNPDTIIRDLSEYEMDVADVYINANAQGYLPMDEGDTFEFNIFRDWHAVEGISNAKTALPDVSYQVIDIDGSASDVVTIVPNQNNSSVATMTANKEGTAIVLVTYDAMYSTLALRGAIGTDTPAPAFFSAIWPENTGVLVVSVGIDGSAIETNMTLNGHGLDAEHDVLYYVGNDGASYTFTPETDSKVAIARAELTRDSLTYSGFEPVDANADGSFTITGLTEGSHIIRVEKDGLFTYQVICAKQTTVTITDESGNTITEQNPTDPGETVTVQLGSIYNPVNKLSGIYNSNCAIVYTGEDDRTFNGDRGSGFGYYLFASDPEVHKIKLTIPEVWAQDTYSLTGGYFSLGGNGKSAGAHRTLRYATGAEMDSNSPATAALLGSLPQITIPVNASERVAATEIVLNKTTLSLNIDGADQLAATLIPNDTTDRIVWTSSAPGVATVSKDGLVTGVAAGEAVISATAGDVSATCTVTVSSQQAVNLVLTTQNAYNNEVYLTTTEFSEITLSGLVPTGTMTGVEVKGDKNVIDKSKTCTISVAPGNYETITVSLKPLLGAAMQNAVSKLTYSIGDTGSNALSTYTDFVYTTSVAPDWNNGQAVLEVKLILNNKTVKDTYTINLLMEEGGEPEPATYTVTLPTETTGYTAAATESSTSPVTEGGSYSFTVTVAEGYETGENFAVKANGTTLTAVEDVYTISNITADQTITVEGVVEKPVVEKLTVTVNVAPSTASVTFYSVEIFAVELAAEDIADNGVVGNYHQYVLTVAAGTYSYRGMDSEQYLGGMTFAVDAENTAFNLRRVNYYGNKNATANVGDYTLTLEDAVCGTQYVDSSRGAVTPVLLIARGSSQKYTPAVNLSDTVAENYIIKSISQTSVSMSTSAQNASFSLTSLLTHTITAPADAVVKVFNQTKNYVVENVAATGTTTNTDGTVTTAFKIPAGSSYSYRVSKEGKITYAGYLNSTTADAIVVNYENSPSPTTTESTASNKESSVLVNVNGQNDMTLAVGETFRLRAFRAWQIVNTVTANIMIEPDYHYTVLSGAEHIELVPVTDKCTGSAGSGINSNWIDIRGISEGTAVVEVSYDAIVVGSSVYGATAPARKMLVVIHVGGTETTAFITADGFAEPWDAEFDTVYFTESTGTLTFSAVVGDRAAKTVALSTDNGSTWTDLSSEGGKYTASGLVEGCNLLKLTADGITEYQVVRAAKISYTITRDGTALTEGDKIQVGDELVIAFDGLFTPVPKMSGIYNPGYVGWPADKVANGHKVVYTVPEGWTASNAFSQYDFATNNAYTVTVGTAVDAVLSGGYIKFNNMGDPAGAHRNLTDEGRTVNTTASNAYYTRCVLPDILIAAAPAAYTVTLPTETTGYTVTETEGSTFPVVEGGSYSFTVTIADGYEAGENFAIKANDDELTDVEGVYTISNITADQTVTVEGVVEKQEEPALTWQEVMAKTKAYLTAQVEEKAPVVASQKGEWVVLGLARDGVPTDSEFFNTYYENVVAYVDSKINAENGRLHAQKSTDNSRVILALSALGKDVTNVGGHNLLQGLSDTAYVRNQGINGPVWALIALDSRNYDIPVNADSSRQVTREWLISHILENELPGGGWALSGQIPDDMTPMAVQALAPYYDSNADVNVAVDRALMVMETMTATTETYAQIIVARSTLGLDSEAVIDNMLTYALGDGRFEKGHGSGANQMSTEQAFYAMVAYERYLNDENSLYDMSDVVIDDGNGGDTPDDPENPDEPDNPGGGDEPEDDEEEKLIFGLSRDEIAGWVIVSFEDKGVRRNEELSDIEPQFRKPLGSIVPMTRVPFRIGDTIAAVTIRLLEEKGLTACYQGDAFGGFYLEAIGNFTIKGTYYESFGEFDAGVDSGWMITWDDWFINEGASEFTVENNDLVKWQYTCQLGEDIGDPYWGEGSGGGSAEDEEDEEEDEEENEDEAGSATEATKADEVFSDVKGHWGSEAINYVYEKGLMNGVSDTEFAPDAPLNRAMLVTILYRMAGEPEVSGVSEFDDVSADTWYSKAVIWAAANGIVDGVSDTEFAPTKNITREQMAVMLMRYANYMCYSMATNGDVSSYADSGSISAWAKAAVEWANAEGLINGRTEDTIVPGGTATRAEAATILMRFLESIAK